MKNNITGKLFSNFTVVLIKMYFNRQGMKQQQHKKVFAYYGNTKTHVSKIKIKFYNNGKFLFFFLGVGKSTISSKFDKNAFSKLLKGTAISNFNM